MRWISEQNEGVLDVHAIELAIEGALDSVRNRSVNKSGNDGSGSNPRSDGSKIAQRVYN